MAAAPCTATSCVLCFSASSFVRRLSSTNAAFFRRSSSCSVRQVFGSCKQIAGISIAGGLAYSYRDHGQYLQRLVLLVQFLDLRLDPLQALCVVQTTNPGQQLDGRYRGW
eukprot:SAG22_NODE_3564_length_1640_cov_1.006489_4_plen_110_part_00